MIVDDIEDDLDAGIVKAGDHLLKFGEGEIRHVGVTPGRSKEGDCIVAPVIGETLVEQIAVVDEGVYRQQLHRRKTQTADMIEHARLGQPAKGAAQILGYRSIELGVAAHVHFVDDGALPPDTRRALLSPRESGVNHTAARHKRRAVAIVEGEVIAAFHADNRTRQDPIPGCRPPLWRRDREEAC